jgi:phage terminase large subunit GpA-like protein
MAVKGVGRGAALIGTPTAVDVSQAGKKLRRGIKLFSVTVSIAKLEFYNNLRKSADVAEDGITSVYPPGYVHLPKIDAEFVQQLCAEQLVTRRDRRGFPVREWQKLRERNEGLDIYVYARAAAAAAGLDRFEERHWRELERSLGVADAIALPSARPDGSPPIAAPQTADPPSSTAAPEPLNKATHGHSTGGGLVVSGGKPAKVRRVIRSPWLR